MKSMAKSAEMKPIAEESDLPVLNRSFSITCLFTLWKDQHKKKVSACLVGRFSAVRGQVLDRTL